MKIYVYHSKIKDLMRTCSHLMLSMGFSDEGISSGRNWLKGETGLGLHSTAFILDLVFREDEHCTSISIIASKVSVVFGNLEYDQHTEQEFADRILRHFNRRLQDFSEYSIPRSFAG